MPWREEVTACEAPWHRVRVRDDAAERRLLSAEELETAREEERLTVAGDLVEQGEPGQHPALGASAT